MSTKAPASNPAFKVAFPFDGSNGTHADMILRSADGLDFRVLKNILAMSSPVFHDMTALAEPVATQEMRASSEVSEDGLPIVIMYESNANVLDALLRILYPVVPPDLDDLGLVSGLLRTAHKYDMAPVMHVVEDALRKAACEKEGVRSMEVYVIAWEYRLEDIIRVAINEFLKCPLKPEYFSGLENVTASALFRLFDYRRKVADKVDTLFSPLSKHNLPPKLLLYQIECTTRRLKPAEGCGSNEDGMHISGWWASLRESARCKIQKAPLSPNIINHARICDTIYPSKCCMTCMENVIRSMTAIDASVKQEMRRLAAEVQFEFP